MLLQHQFYHENLDLSCMMDPDFWDCFGMEKPPSYTQEIQYQNTKKARRILLRHSTSAKKGNRDNFPYFSIKTYIVTLIRTVLP